VQTDHVRDVVARITHSLGELSSARENRLTLDGLTADWRALVAMLDVAPPAQLRDCPRCGQRGMAAATLCGHCWVKLTPDAGPARP
jgi:hypothetical protein